MKLFIERFTKWCIYGTFFVPLIVLPSSFIFPFIVPKIVIFRSLVALMVGGYTLLLVSNWEMYRPRRNPATTALFAFLLSFAISTFVGTDPYHSFWDNHERMLGLFTIAHYVAYFFVASSVFKNWTEWKTALRWFLAAGSIVMIIGVFQVIDPNFLLNRGDVRVSSTLGNSIYVGGYGLFLLFVATLLFLKETNVVVRTAYGLAGALGIAGIIFSGARGAFLGLVAGVATVIALYAILLKDKPRIRHIVWGLAGVALLLSVILYTNRTSSFVRAVPVLDRVLSTTWSGFSASPRFLAWQVAVESWKTYPLFGWGPNNFFYAYNENFNPRALEYGYGETWFDNAHNIILNTLAVQGIVGLGAYLAIYITAILLLLRAFRESRVSREVYVIGTSFLVAHLVQNVTVFENPTSYLYFMFWLAMIVSLATSQKTSPDTKNESVTRSIKTELFASVGVVVLLFIFIFNVKPAQANMNTLRTLQALSQNMLGNLTVLESALNGSSPHIDDIRNDLASSILGFVGSAVGKISPEQAFKILDILEPAILKNIELHPRDIRVYLTMNQLQQIRLGFKQDVRYVIASEYYLEKALSNSPRRQQIIYNLATAKLQLGKNQEAIDMLEKVVEEKVKVGESYWRLMIAYRIAGEYSKVDEVYKRALSRGIVFLPDEQATIAQVLDYKEEMAAKKAAASKK
jgi:O-antigen ligase